MLTLEFGQEVVKLTRVSQEEDKLNFYQVMMNLLEAACTRMIMRGLQEVEDRSNFEAEEMLQNQRVRLEMGQLGDLLGQEVKESTITRIDLSQRISLMKN